MKCRTVIDKSREEEVVIYVHERTAVSDEIEEFVLGRSPELIGYIDDEIIRFSPSEIFCFVTEDNKVFAVRENERLRLKQRLYVLEEILDTGFVKINQSCIVNVSKIKKFSASVGGALLVELKNGYRDYVSRRQLRAVKERIGI